MTATKKNETVTFRMDEATLSMIQRAAHVCGKSVTSFVTEAAIFQAQKELMDQRFLGLDAAIFDDVEALLSEPATANEALVKLFRAQPEWID
jgi:uncharacterized protein (DUF1778 family)